jgi:Helix-turn-helix domain
MKLIGNEALLDKRETAAYLRISVPSVNKHLHGGLLVPTRVGGRVFFRKRTLDEFVATSERRARREASERRRNGDA